MEGAPAASRGLRAESLPQSSSGRACARRQPRSLAAKRFLRSPRVIIGEILAITLAGIVGAVLPQAGTASVAELGRLREHGDVLTVLVDALALDHVFSSYWFLTLILLAAASLSLVLMGQLKRLRRSWSQRLTPAHFRNAPFQLEFERSARACGADANEPPRVHVNTSGRLGLAGSAVFHFGILLLIAAGVVRALFAVDAVVDVVEGETLRPTPNAWVAQWPGILAKPLQLDRSVTLEEVNVTRYRAGDLKSLTARLSFKESQPIVEEIAINRELQVFGGRLFMSAHYGPAALVAWQSDTDPTIREAALLQSQGQGSFEGISSGPGGLRAHLRAQVDRKGNKPTSVEARIMDGPALLFAGAVPVGGTIPLRDGRSLTLHAAPFWTRLHGSRDPAQWIVYIGFGLVIVGSLLIFTVVKVDTCLSVATVGDRERVFVALRAQRFAPVFRERFERLVREQGGPS